MNTKTKNILTFLSGVLLLAALIIYLISPGSAARDIVLAIASLIAGIPIAIKAFQALRMKAFSIDLLVTIAVVGAMIIGEYAESAVVTFLFLFGDYLEGRTLRKTRASLKSLMDMAPLEATVLREGVRLTIPAEELRVGDHVIVQPGGRIPVDGIVITGQSLINQAAITGESVPVSKRAGDQVFSSTVSDNGYLEILAEKVGDDTTFSKIIELVEEAQEAKAKTQKFMERFARYYTPGIIVLSVLVGLITQNVHLALTFLVIACPGALVISVPVSIVAGIGNGAKNGILIKGGDKMENLAKVNAIVFDKTGTLTKGRPEVTAVKSYGIQAHELLRMAAEVEVTSEHHLGKTIVKKAVESDLELRKNPTDVEILKGYGIRAMLDTAMIYIGNRAGAGKLGIPLDDEKAGYLQLQEEKGNTAVLVAADKEVVGIISIADQVREEAPAAIQALKENGIDHTVMLTGDNPVVAQKVAEQVGIDRVFAGLLPEDKVEKIRECKASGINLAMVGDGINDAPAIAAADVGIAMGGTATDVTMQTADVILMSDKLDKLPYAIKLAKATVRNMKQNTYFALITVVFLLTGVLTNNIHLASGMLIHEASVLLVILNAVRLVSFPKLQLRNPLNFCRSMSCKIY
ncbi:MAG: cation-translocating P-type ATPase [Bacteroidales bacterium]|nr:cation-translocating P-type ATPase [Bacteroidales bacterium]MDD3522415.1 cation-translocating P-type ATPase [Bacteroidales bacterium]MDD4030814.1 cation-translocating P-type ATPase [Bacteroidales bacterium]MDD4436160.1 cation-translocating P-type ATPase [Bacteroidales bacterium]MDD5732768.1 cation-translocating P-type ATPase [Bacteroidales bacterium]